MPTSAPPAPRTLTTGDVARALETAKLAVELVGPADVRLTRFEAADRAGEGDLTFLRTEKYVTSWRAGHASAALVTRPNLPAYLQDGKAPAGRTLIVVDDVDLASAVALSLFAPPHTDVKPGVHPSAVIDSTARVAASAYIGPQCFIGPGATIAEHAILHAQDYVGRDASIGPRTMLHPGVKVLDRCRVGADCILHAGVAIGADGFGFAVSRTGLTKIPHIGDVVIEDKVEIGANTCVDRAKFGSTIIGAGSKIDNLVQIAHNCRIGRSCVICGQTSLAGSVVLGDGVMLGGSVGVADNVEIGAGARVAAFAGVHNAVPPNADYMGVPAGPARQWRRTYAILGSLSEHLAEIRKALRGQQPLP